MRPANDESKLPRWVRNLLLKLRADIIHYKKRAFRVEVAGPTSAYIDTAGDRHYLPEHRVVFELDSRETVAVEVVEHIDGSKWLQVWTNGMMQIRPTSGNVIHVNGRLR